MTWRVCGSMITTAQNVGSDKKPGICFVAHNAYGAISGVQTGHIGGIERQQSLMARWLAGRGYPVSILTWDQGQGHEARIDGIRVLAICRRSAGIKALRFFHPRWTGLVRAMRRANARIYYHNCGEYVTGQVAAWCRASGRKFVYSVASNPDVDPQLPEMKTLRERILYPYGLKRADRVIVQTMYQQRVLQQRWGISSVIIPMPCQGPDNDSYTPPDLVGLQAARILWVGRIGTEKRREWLLDVAQRCPDLGFDVVGHPHVDNLYISDLMKRARSLPNLAVHGYVAYEQMKKFYCRALLLCCTSTYEGFPNTFIEAWSYGLPVVTTFDPDRLISARGLGGVAEDVAGLIESIRQLRSSPDAYAKASKAARLYFLENHTVDAVMPCFERVFLDAAGDTSKR